MKNKEQLLAVADFLANLGQKNSVPCHPHTGICYNFRQYFGRGIWELPNYNKLVEAWPHYSGHISYPVPSPFKGIEAGNAYGKNKWAGRYGEKRRLFARYLAREYRKMAKTLDTTNETK